MFIEKENNLNETGSQAEKNCRKALAEAGYAFGEPASFHWSQLTNPRGQKEVAITAYQTLIEQEHNNKSALEGLAYLYQIMGHSEQAREYRRKLKEVEASEYGIEESDQSDVVDYLLAKTGDAAMPDSVPANYVAAHFDKYASKFDVALVDNLQYQGPDFIQQQVASFLPTAANNLNVLDLGCGTGLVGEALVPFAKSMTGVDVSGDMLELADGRGCYNRLIKDDCLDFFETNEKSYDLVTAGDVLIYLGEVSNLFTEVSKVLNKSGLFIFTIECSKTDGFRLSNTGRFQHNPEYIKNLARQNNFQILTEQQVPLRKERGEAIDAMLFCLQTGN